MVTIIQYKDTVGVGVDRKENENDIQDVAATQLRLRETETEGWLLMSGKKSEKHGCKKHV